MQLNFFSLPFERTVSPLLKKTKKKKKEVGDHKVKFLKLFQMREPRGHTGSLLIG